MTSIQDQIASESWHLSSESLPQEELEIVQRTLQRFVKDEVYGLGLEFKVWDWSKPELYGIYLGMFVTTRIITKAESLNLLLDLTIDIIKGYASNPYHCHGHAFDVAYMVYFIITTMSLADQMSMTIIEITALLLGALGHDVEHPGLNNMFQVNANTELAKKYQNVSVLETYSADVLSQLLEKHSFLESIFTDDQSSVNQTKELIRLSILKTDMAHHFTIYGKLVAYVDSRTLKQPLFEEIVVESPENSVSETLSNFGCLSSSMGFKSIESLLEPVDVNDAELRETMVCAILHAADISNPARPFEVCKRWSDMVIQEFFAQGDEERRLALPVSPNMDRDTTNQIQLSSSFTDAIVKPFYELLTALFPRMQVFLDLLNDNARHWESIISTLPAPKESDDIKSGELNEESNNALPAMVQQKTRRKLSGRKVSMAAGTVDIPDEDLLPRNRISLKGRKRIVSQRVSTVGNGSWDDIKVKPRSFGSVQEGNVIKVSGKNIQ